MALLDIRMPGTDGLAAAGAIAANPKTSACRVVMLTTYDLDEYLFEALHAGRLVSSSKAYPPRT